jgi:hypothetical protein
VAIFRASFSVAAGASAAANLVLLNLKAGTVSRLRVMELGLFVEVAPTTPPVIGLSRMNAVGTGAITSTSPEKNDTNDVAAAVLETAWATTRPTITGNPLARFQLPVTLGSAIIYDLTNRPIVVATSGGLIVQEINAGGATGLTLGGWIAWEE